MYFIHKGRCIRLLDAVTFKTNFQMIPPETTCFIMTQTCLTCHTQGSLSLRYYNSKEFVKLKTLNNYFETQGSVMETICDC